MSHNALEILKDLVDALDSTTWSSWQTTARFQDQLEAAREYLVVYHEEYVNEYI